MNFCSECGAPVVQRIPEGDHFPRHVCTRCGTIHYRNPKVIVGCVPEWQGRILLCRRAIEPRLGRWTFPAGFLEIGETTAQGAARETLEESGAEVEVGGLLSVISVPHVEHLYLIHRARMQGPKHHPTDESSETMLVEADAIPWTEIAFPTIHHSLRFFLDDRAAGREDVHWMDLLPPVDAPPYIP